MSKVIFLVGAPGSGKDFLLRNVLGEHKLVELSLDKLYTAISTQNDLYEVDSHQSIIVNGNAERASAISTCTRVLEAMGYETSMLYVYTTDAVSKQRNDVRLQKGSKTFTEAQRKEKYGQATQCLKWYSETFKPFWLFDNSAQVGTLSEEVKGWLTELSQEVSTFLETQTTKDYVKHMSGPRVPPAAPAPAQSHQSNIKGFERVKDGNRWVLRRKQTTESSKYNSSLNHAFETYTATAVDNSRGNINVTDNGSPTENPATVMAKVLKPIKTTRSESLSVDITHGGDPESKKRSEKKAKDAEVKAAKAAKTDKDKPAKGASPPPNFFDSKMGGVPSGSLGLTSEYKPTGTPLSELRKRMRK
jgi:predicted ABC-type ATPase